jgi:hypothetical protein
VGRYFLNSVLVWPAARPARCCSARWRRTCWPGSKFVGQPGHLLHVRDGPGVPGVPGAGFRCTW